MSPNAAQDLQKLHELAPPLTMPEEVWQGFSPDVKAIYRRAQIVLDNLSINGRLTVRQLWVETQFSVDEITHSLSILTSLGLVSVLRDDLEIFVVLLAIPVEHVSAVGPDGVTRWYFVSKRLGSTGRDPAMLD